MQRQHRRLKTMIYLNQVNPDASSSEEMYVSSDSSVDQQKFFRGLPQGSVYVQAFRLWPQENYSTDFDSFFNSSVEILISELDRISEHEHADDTNDFTRIMQDIMRKQIQNEYARLAAQRELKHHLLLSLRRRSHSLNLINV